MRYLDFFDSFLGGVNAAGKRNRKALEYDSTQSGAVIAGQGEQLD